MKLRINEIIKALLSTLVILVILELFSSVVLPLFGLKTLRLSFNILIILFLCLRFNSPLLPYCILIIQWVHSIFSIEGWAIGTVVGILTALFINYLKDLISMTSLISTMIIVQLFQIGWFIVSHALLGFKIGNYDIIAMQFPNFLPQSIILSLMSPFIFKVLEAIWKQGDEHSSGVLI